MDFCEILSFPPLLYFTEFIPLQAFQAFLILFKRHLSSPILLKQEVFLFLHGGLRLWAFVLAEVVEKMSNTLMASSLFSCQQFHLRRASALRVGLPFGFFIGPFIPLIRAQNDLRRFAALLPFFNLEGGVVTAVFSLLPGLALL